MDSVSVYGVSVWDHGDDKGGGWRVRFDFSSQKLFITAALSARLNITPSWECGRAQLAH